MPPEESRIVLPPAPASLSARPVRGWREPVSIDTYGIGEPDRYPAYLDQRVYQGSSGAVYPMPFVDRVEHTKAPREWDAIHLENAFVRLMVLPELGGRIHVGLDRTRGYDFFYRNDVIKPALVGLLGPWVSGGVELNWPQHHRPATFLPVETWIESEPDGAVTVWCSDHDPFARLQGMHGVRLRPDSALVELRVRLVNRTDDVQTFLWWANVAAAVHDDYQAFFPTDVTVVADHAKRAVTTFPAASGRYYGVDYPARRTAEHPDGDRLDWYRNIPVPTSYMCLGSQDDFFGGYDHAAGAGFVHWADHRISPGKKMWTWGDAPFGRAWDRHLTDTNGPYIELMAGVFTDNQPDFAFLRPGETTTFSQYWYPIQDIGPVHQATRDAAVRLDVGTGGTVRVGVAVTSPRPGARVVLRAGEEVLLDERADVAPGNPLVRELTGPPGVGATGYELVVEHDGATLLTWRPRAEAGPDSGPDADPDTGPDADPGTTIPEPAMPEPATEPPAPADIDSLDELYVTGLHLEQYRHATRSPEPYWTEALRRDPGDARCATALAARRARAGRLADAERLLRTATARLTLRNPNPRDGEAHYRLGVVLARQGRTAEAREALGTASWDQAWRDAAAVATARLDLAEGRDADAAEQLEALLRRSPEHVQGRNLAAVAAGRIGDTQRARDLVRGTLAVDPLDAWARDLAARLGAPTTAGPTTDPTVALDVALEHASAGQTAAAVELLEDVATRPSPRGQRDVRALALLHLADLELTRGDHGAAADALERARRAPRDWAFPAATDDDALARLRRAWPQDPLVAGLAGHRLYAAGRRDEAIAAWEVAASGDGTDPVVLRNLGVAAHNVQGDAEAAAAWYARARAVAPDDARLLYEADQLEARRGTAPEHRLAVLLDRPDLVGARDDLSVQVAELLTAVGRADDALEILTGRPFQPWEGGEGRVLAAWDAAHLALGRGALDDGDAAAALAHAAAALDPPASLGEARHPLANTADLHLLLGDALAAVGRSDDAREAWRTAADQQGDFEGMAVQDFSERTAASVLALRRLGRDDEARLLRDGLARYVEQEAGRRATVDYFATSLPTMLLFTHDVQEEHDDRVRALRNQLAALDRAATHRVRVTRPPAVRRDHLALGSPPGTPDAVAVTGRYLERAGRPWFPVTGEVHYSRIPRERWSEVLGHARAGGLDSVATYVFWQAHEPTPGDFRWDGNLDLRAFVELAARHGLAVIVRMGPWAHGEARYGGFPDWLVERGVAARTNDPAYLDLVRAFYAQTIAQLDGLLHAQGGPVIGAQMDNELYDQPEHLAMLRTIAEELGLQVPLWTATGWGGAQVPDTLLPVYSAYADGFWEDADTEWPAFAPVHFRYSTVRDDLSVGADLREALDGLAVDRAAEPPGPDDDLLPYATCELGGGMHVAYHRRPLVTPDDVAALALAKIGSGSVWQGYYMYAGGTQRVGPRGTEQESQATGYPNDVPTRTYDFGAPVGEHGQVRRHHHLLRRQHLWLRADGDALAAMTTTVGGGSDDPSALRWSVRSDGRRGYVFLTTYQPARRPLAAQPSTQVQVEQEDTTVTVPTRPVDLPAGLSVAWPLRYPLAEGLVLRSATAQLLTRVSDGGGPGIAGNRPGELVVLVATDGVPVELVLDGDVEATGPVSVRREGGTTVLDLTGDPGPETVVRLHGAPGTAGESGVRVLVLDEATANRLYRLDVGGRERLVLCDAPVHALDGNLVVHTDEPTTTVSVLPAPASLAASLPLSASDGATATPAGEAGTLWSTWTLAVPGAGSRRVAADLRLGAPAPPLPARGGPMDRLSAPTDFTGAARVHLDVPADALAGVDRALLRVSWTGDVGRALVGGEVVSDHFWHGRAWDVDLTPWRDDVARDGVTLDLLPWRAEIGVWVDPSVRDVPDGITVEAVDVVRVARTVLTLKEDA
ncbi:tetratricopeptide repeat protein [Isoptericola sp. CG 20/1183]|uniref:Tetratricopeptide repeat protein n=1 Tax=Isoptericola halotolerans TaxID=300560 RepID=A0ABX5EHM3_9MICO|nr:MULTISPECIES: DUF5107 domain-containing protein [Isoptericola]PRZ08835.1 tetratricopeptide repeat protein [Isoptericola halotolerans]PRZ10718.1 tetratricopeptide repeat protein [Isoptericola sp. CG 20/1183]